MSEAISRRHAAALLGGGLLTGGSTGPGIGLPVQDAHYTINVRDYGARGDGSSDDTAAFRAAIEAAPQWGVVIVPPGFYVLKDTVPCSKDRFTLMGYGSVDSGQGGSAIRYEGEGVAFDAFNAEFNRVSMRIANLTFQGRGVGIGLRLNAHRAHIENCSFNDFDVGIRISDSQQNLVEPAIYRCVFARCHQYGIDVDGTRSTDGFITDCVAMESEVGIRVVNGDGWLLSGNHIYSCAVGIRIGGSMMRLQSNYFEADNHPRPVGLEITLNAVTELSVVMGNVFLTFTDGATLTKVIAASDGRVLFSANQFFAVPRAREVTGVAVEGPGKLYGTLTFNNFSINLAQRVTGAPDLMEFIHFAGDQLLTQANELQLSRWSRTPTVLASDGRGNANLTSGWLRLQSESRLHSGAGQPSDRVGENGDFYFRSDGSTGTALYYRARGRWSAIA